MHQNGRYSGMMSVLCVLMAGCGFVPPLPATLDVAMSDAESAPAPAGSGPTGFANTVWSLTRKADAYDPYGGAGEPMADDGYGGLLRGEPLERPPVGGLVFVVHFGANGEMVEVTENEYLLPEIYGTKVPVGGGWIGTPLPGLTFRSESYGLQEGDHYALAACFQVRAVSFLIAHATVYSYGDVEGGRAEGTFGYILDFSDGLLGFADQIADEYPVVGQQH